MADHTVELKPEKLPDGSIKWTMEYGGKKGSSPGTYPVIDLKAKEGHKLTYNIDNPAGLSINFDPAMIQTASGQSIHNALWVQPDTKPTKAVLSDQIDDVDVKPTKLKFDDQNTGPPVKLIYQINFVDAGTGTTVTPLDPELKNGGGNTTFDSYAVVAVVVVGALLLAGLLFRRFREAPRRTNPTA